MNASPKATSLALSEEYLVLIVDDDPTLRSELHHLLTDLLSITIIEIGSLNELNFDFSIFKSIKAIAFIDIRFHDSNLIDAFRKMLKVAIPYVEFIVLSSYLGELKHDTDWCRAKINKVDFRLNPVVALKAMSVVAAEQLGSYNTVVESIRKQIDVHSNYENDDCSIEQGGKVGQQDWKIDGKPVRIESDEVILRIEGTFQEASFPNVLARISRIIAHGEDITDTAPKELHFKYEMFQRQGILEQFAPFAYTTVLRTDGSIISKVDPLPIAQGNPSISEAVVAEADLERAAIARMLRKKKMPG
jgi:DNA-binding LytR/AlgR family response regulator